MGRNARRLKPMFELGLAAPPTDSKELDEATDRARAGLEACGWKVVASLTSPVTGARAAIEVLVHARRA